jgi:hypothetical protein
MAMSFAALHHLALLVQRLLDAELLLEEDGAILLTETEATRRSLEAGDREVAHQHIERLTQRAKALIEDGALDTTNGHALIEAARHIVAKAPD